VIGLGRIGTAAALRAKAFGMDVVFYDPYIAPGVDRALGIRRVDHLKELLSQCHVVSIHANLTDETREMINENTLSYAKRGIIILNTARGDIIDLEALYLAMRTNIVAAAGLDVLPVETKGAVNPGDPRTQRLIRAWCDNEDWIKERLILTPHSAYLTEESSLDMRKMPIKIVASFLNENRLLNCVNDQYLDQKLFNQDIK
jgi:phosphoglycerate dehydrogenase-like enzyme